MTDLPKCRICGADPITRFNGVLHPFADCPLDGSRTMTQAQWTALMGVDRDAVRYRWLRRKVGATGPAGNDYRKWQFTFPTNLTLKVSELNITDIESDFNNAIDSAMGEQQ